MWNEKGGIGMSKKEKRVAVVLAVVLIVFSVAAFALPFEKNGMFWLSYVFGIIAIVTQLYVWKVAFQGADTVKSKFYGFPVAKIGITYMVVQLALSLIFMALAAVAPVWLATILYVLILGAAVIGSIGADAAREVVERQEIKVQKDTACMKRLCAQVDTLSRQCEEPGMKKELEKLADAFRYSDPVSSEALKESEAELEDLVSRLQEAVSNQEENRFDLIKKIQSVLETRNRLCKLNK
jgi:hypothetical protein